MPCATLYELNQVSCRDEGKDGRTGNEIGFHLSPPVGPGQGCRFGGSSGLLSPINHRWPKGSTKLPWRCSPHGIAWLAMGTVRPTAPCRTARASRGSGSSQNSSTLQLGRLGALGTSQPFPLGSPTKTGAPRMLRPTTEPRSHI